MSFIVWSLGVALLLMIAAGTVAAWKTLSSPWGLLALVAVLAIRFFAVMAKKELDSARKSAQRSISGQGSARPSLKNRKLGGLSLVRRFKNGSRSCPQHDV